MPLAPPVTTTTLPATCIVALRFIFSRQHNIQHGGVMTGCAEQHKTMPDRILEAQPPPGMENDAKTVQHAADHHKPQRHGGQRCYHGVVEHEAAPAHREIEADRQPVETASISRW